MRRTCLAVALVAVVQGCATTSGGPPPSDPNCAWNVCVGFRDSERGRSYIAVNREPVPATVVVTFLSLTNLQFSTNEPVERIIPAGSSRTLVRLRKIDTDRPASARPTFAIDLGSADTEPDVDFPYRVPFGGSVEREIIQGFGGTDSHLGGMRFSVDFGMPEGTPVVATRAGTVLYLQDGFTRGGTDPDLLDRANLVVVAHSDGTMASYGHLSPGIAVSIGDRVDAGDLLGYSGATGFAGRPHLHFHVGKRLLRDPGRTVPIRIVGPNGQPIDLIAGTRVAPAPPNPASP